MFCDFIWVNAMESPAKDRCPVRPKSSIGFFVELTHGSLSRSEDPEPLHLGD